jgi:heavy metal translocating P-type ATPase
MSRRVPAVVLPATAALAILAGLLARYAMGDAVAAHTIWRISLFLTATPLLWRLVGSIRHGQFATDIVASLAILGAIALDQPLAGLVVVLMQSGGESLEVYAAGRASRAVRALEEAAPRVAHRLTNAGLEDIAVDAVTPGDRLLVRPGEMIPCDATVLDGDSHVDTSSLTGEAVPVRAVAGVTFPSGSLNLEGPITLRATARARESQYARIVDLVRSAQEQKAPMQRMADRYAAWFTPVTLAVCLVAWLISRDPTRVLAVLVVATPCPLILATPVALIGGINRAARRGLIFRSGTALEQLGGVTAAVFDKTGTLTIGRPRVRTVGAVPPWTEAEVLRLAASVERGSGHLLARSVVEAGEEAGLPLIEPRGVVEAPGRGVSGQVGTHQVSIGARSFINERHPRAEAAMAAFEAAEGRPEVLRAWVAIDGTWAGTVDYADQLRPGLAELLATLGTAGVRRTILLSGDTQANADAVARSVGIPTAFGNLLPPDKVATVRQLLAEGERVLMVGDGTNDAPALSAATVGVVLAAHGGGIAAEAADVVLLADDLTLVAAGIAISRRTLRIARLSIWAGLGLSGMAMLAAAAGYVPPTLGAVLQEGIDVAAILNALRAAAPAGRLAPGTPRGVPIPKAGFEPVEAHANIHVHAEQASR